jgi:hypothetical protein
MKLHLLTAITRPENLAQIAASVAVAQTSAPDVALVWHWRCDPERRHPGGQGLKNQMLDDIADGWVWILDDDNLMRPDFLVTIQACIEAQPAAQMLVCAQQHADGRVRRVNRAMLRETHVDAAQAIIAHTALGTLRIPEHYCGDGAFIEALADRLTPDQIAYMHRPIVNYNALRGLA